MNLQKINLIEQSSFVLQNGCLVKFKCNLSRVDVVGDFELFLSVESSATLSQVVDNSQTSDVPTVWIIQGNTERFFVCGGLFGYFVDQPTFMVCDSFHLFRDKQDEEFWEVHFEETDEGELAVYEGGAFLLSKELTLLWHIEKLYNHRFARIEEGKVFLELEDGSYRILALIDGKET